MIQDIFPIRLYKTHFEGTEELKKILVPKIEETFKSAGDEYTYPPAKMTDGGLISYGKIDVRDWPELKDFFIFLKKELDVYWSYISNKPYNLVIDQTWISYYPSSGAFIDWHKHPNVPIAIVFYLQKLETAGNILFRQPRNVWKFANIKNYERYFNFNETLEIEVNEGDILMFPGFFDHKSQANNSSISRIVIGLDTYTSD